MVGDKIKEYRIKSGLYQQDLAEKLGVGKSTVAMWEVNKREPNIETLKRIAFTLGCHLYDLIETDEKEESKEKKFYLDFSDFDAIDSICRRSYSNETDFENARLIMINMRFLNSAGLEKLLERVSELQHMPQYNGNVIPAGDPTGNNDEQ